MSQAIVIPFPGTTPMVGEQDRLRRALGDLQVALLEQKRALSDWRFSMMELGASVARLGQALGDYQHSLRSVAERLNGLRETGRLVSTTV